MTDILSSEHELSGALRASGADFHPGNISRAVTEQRLAYARRDEVATAPGALSSHSFM